MRRASMALRIRTATRIRLTMGLLLLVVALVVAVACDDSGEEKAASIQLGDNFTAVINLLRSDAATMQRHGETMIQAGTADNNSTWVAHGQHLQDDAASLELLADQLSRTSASLHMFLPSIELPRLAADAQTLIKAGQQIETHGQSMKGLAAAMRQEAQALSKPALAQSLDLMSADADVIMRDGREVRQLGENLSQEAERLARSLGINLPQ